MKCLPAIAGVWLSVFMLAVICTGASGSDNTGQAAVQLGPEINVGASYGHPELSQYQSDLRCDPNDERQMCIICKHNTTPTQGERETMLFHTADGGATWTAELIPLTADPDVYYDAAGRAHASFITHDSHAHPLGYRRSTDGGATWSAMRVLDPAIQLDHPHIICDRGSGPFRGSIYIAGRPFKGGGITVFRSRDGGETFQATQVPLSGIMGAGFVYKPAVLANGDLLIPVESANRFLSDSRGYYAGNLKEVDCLRSTDGGATFGPPVKITDLPQPVDPGVGGAAEIGGIAAGKWGRGQRVYMTFSKEQAGKQPAALVITTSDDGGLTWSFPHAIAPSVPAGSGAGSSSVLANKDGVVGVQWYQMHNDRHFDIYFAASLDGAATFSPPVRVSSETSQEGKNEARYPGQDQVYGDTAADGSFRLVWTDGRNGAPSYVLYYRSARVERHSFTAPVRLAVTGGFGSGAYERGAAIAVTADAPPAGQEFAGWVAGKGVDLEEPSCPVTQALVTSGDSAGVTATYRPQTQYKLSVDGGDGSGSYPAGTLVTVTAKPGQADTKFGMWKAPNGVGFLDPKSASTQMRMPARDVAISTVYTQP